MLAMANRIEELLNKKGWSIYRLHQEIGMTYNATHALVKSKNIPNGTAYGTLKRIAKALGVKIDDLESKDN